MAEVLERIDGWWNDSPVAFVINRAGERAVLPHRHRRTIA
jgi:hypothetical protein